jgi:microcystin degradation protein MlrC
MPIRKAIDRARAIMGSGMPVLLVDSADSPGAGCTGDSSYVAEHLVEYAGDLFSIGTVVDQEAAARAWEQKDGASFECDLGFKESPMFGKPFHFTGTVERHCDPTVTDAESSDTYTLGKRVVLRRGNARIMVMENAGFGHNPVLFTSAGYAIKDFDIVCVRSALQYKVMFKGMYREDILVDSPGASNTDLCSLPFHDIVWEAYPFNKDAQFIPHTRLSVR